MPNRSVESFTQEQIDQHLNAALQRLTTDDRALFVHDVNERTICCRLAIYLQKEFQDFNVDCEYNRNHNDFKYAKRLYDPELLRLADEARKEAGRRPLKKGTDCLFVFPDIIIHRRDTFDNLLVIETKKTTSTVKDAFDLRKLCVYRKELVYRFAKFLRFGTGVNGTENLIPENRFIDAV